MSIVRLHRNRGFGRPVHTFSHSSKRYYQMDGRRLSTEAMEGAVSSVDLLPLVAQGSSLCLFANPDHSGSFVVLYSGTPGLGPSGRNRRRVPNLGTFKFDDRTRSVISVIHPSKGSLLLPIGTLFGPRITAEIDKELATISQATRSGPLVFTWAMWSHIAPLEELGLVKVPLDVSVPTGTYKAVLGVPIRFSLNSSGRLRARVYRVAGTPVLDVWVEGGLLSGSIYNLINTGVGGRAGRIDLELARALAPMDGHRWATQYLMPGALKKLDLTKDYTGNTDDDVTLVLVPR